MHNGGKLRAGTPHTGAARHVHHAPSPPLPPAGHDRRAVPADRVACPARPARPARNSAPFAPSLQCAVHDGPAAPCRGTAAGTCAASALAAAAGGGGLSAAACRRRHQHAQWQPAPGGRRPYTAACRRRRQHAWWQPAPGGRHPFTAPSGRRHQHARREPAHGRGLAGSAACAAAVGACCVPLRPRPCVCAPATVAKHMRQRRACSCYPREKQRCCS